MKTSANRIFVVLLCLTTGIFLLSCVVGRYEISISTILGVFTNNISDMDRNVLVNTRIPRAMASILAGGALGLSGAIFQKTFRSPLASPDILGISSGASLGAVISIVFISTSMFYTQVFAFVFGILALFIVMGISNVNTGNKIFGMIVSGIIMNSITSSLVMLFKYIADPERKLPAIEYWIMGGLYNIRQYQVVYLLIAIIICGFLLYRFRWYFTVLSLDDDEILSLGVDGEKTRFGMLVLATILVSITVSICGVIGFVGLIAPYMARMISRRFGGGGLRNSFLIGGSLLGIGDILARNIHESEIPVGIIISILACPILLFMLRQYGGENHA